LSGGSNSREKSTNKPVSSSEETELSVVDDNENNVDYDQNFVEPEDLEAQPEADIEDTFPDDPTATTTPQVEPRYEDDEDDAEASESTEDIPYKTIVYHFMSLLLENTLTKKKRSETALLCPLCQDDDMMNEAAKKKESQPGSYLDTHLKSGVHSIDGRFERKVEAAGYGVLYCPYCLEVAPKSRKERDLSWSSMKKPKNHVRLSTAKSIYGDGCCDWKEDAKLAAAHDRLKARDDWYLDNLSSEQKAYAANVKHQKCMLKRRSLGIQYSDEKELPVGTPHPTILGVQYGQPPEMESIIRERGGTFLGTPAEGRAIMAPSIHQLLDQGIVSYEPLDIPAILQARGVETGNLLSYEEFMEGRRWFMEG
jgi:hypothetical protein